MAGRVFQLFVLAVVAHLVTALPSPAFVTLVGAVGERLPQSASIAGVDVQGHTTYAIPKLDSSLTTANVVAGPDYFSLDTFNAPASFGIMVECGLQGTTHAACTVQPTYQPAPATTDVFTLSGKLQTLILDVPSAALAAPSGTPSSARRQGYSILVMLSLIGLPLVAYQLL
ncbi:hypothetical protein B0H19DRAFT_87767 [Mycena capillaripes]|nr:hypothetical protein B0H19DRAFT_87767 [Mycena capillaripes]